MATSEYSEVLASLYRLEAAKGMDFKLERVARALKNLGDPHQRFPAIHIAGTNGKGSVAAMLHAMFSAGGYRVGLYTSPHLVRFTERIRIGAEEITEQEVVDLARDVRTAATVRGIELTFFEFITVMAFLHFARGAVDLAVVEVGLGGRLDATNVLDPDVAVITSIGLDHEEFLGNTLESVAHEKAGIIKPARPVILGKVPPQVLGVFEEAAANQRAPLSHCGRDFRVTDSQAFGFSGLGCELEDLTVRLRGTYQRDNAATAIAAALRQRLPISDEAIRRGLAEVRWPGRLDVVQRNPVVVLDGAHNLDGITALARELPAIIGARAVHLLFGVMRDKRWQAMIDAIGPLASSVTLTQPLSGRGESPDVLSRAFERYCPAVIAPQPLSGLQRLLRSVREDEAILVAGSLFLVGAVYPHFLHRRTPEGLFGPSPTPLHP